MGGVTVVEDGKAPLLTKLPEASDDPESHIVRTGTLYTAIAHIITAVIGSGVLSLAWSTAQLGWVAGPLAMIFFAAITVIQSSLLADSYRSPHPEHGHIRNHSYMDAVKVNLGEKSQWLSGVFMLANMYGVGIAYTITAANSMRAIQRSNCYHAEGHQAPCEFSGSYPMLIFGAAQILFSQIPNFHEMEWLSVLAAIMSFSYASIGFVLGLVKVIVNGRFQGGIGGVPMATTTQKVLRISQAVGDVAFAYPYSMILLEIEDTLKSPPAENQTMKKATRISIFVTTVFYLCCGCFGYAAFGNDAPGNLLTGFGFYEPYWLIDFANVCVVIHLVGGYQIMSQPVFAHLDRWFAKRFPNSGFVNKSYTIQIPLLTQFRLNLFRLCCRTLYVVSTTGIAVLFPYFNEVIGLLGAFNFWPIAIYFPVEMYLAQKKIVPWTKTWVMFQAFSLVCLLISIFAFVGSVEGVLSESMSRKSVSLI